MSKTNEIASQAVKLSGSDALYKEMHDHIMRLFKRFLENMKYAGVKDPKIGFTIRLNTKDIISKESYEKMSSKSSIVFLAYNKLYSWLNGKYGLEIKEWTDSSELYYGMVEGITIVVNKDVLEKIISDDYVDTDSVWDTIPMDIINATLKTLREVYNKISDKRYTKEFGFCLSLEALICKSGHKDILPVLIKKNDIDFIRKILESLNNWIRKNNLYSNVQELIDDLQTKNVHTILMKTIYVTARKVNPFNIEGIYINRKLTASQGAKDLSLATELRNISIDSKKRRENHSKKWTLLHAIFDHLPGILKDSAKFGNFHCRLSLGELIEECGLNPKEYPMDMKLENFLVGSIRNWCKQKGIQFTYSNESNPQFVFNWE